MPNAEVCNGSCVVKWAEFTFPLPIETKASFILVIFYEVSGVNFSIHPFLKTLNSLLKQVLMGMCCEVGGICFLTHPL